MAVYSHIDLFPAGIKNRLVVVSGLPTSKGWVVVVAIDPYACPLRLLFAGETMATPPLSPSGFGSFPRFCFIPASHET